MAARFAADSRGTEDVRLADRSDVHEYPRAAHRTYSIDGAGCRNRRDGSRSEYGDAGPRRTEIDRMAKTRVRAVEDSNTRSRFAAEMDARIVMSVTCPPAWGEVAQSKRKGRVRDPHRRYAHIARFAGEGTARFASLTGRAIRVSAPRIV